ncbi:DMBT1 protein, partial [Pandion haliaetus]|nr:DMBT1 protein [Pandion haliaetus]
RCAGRVEVKHSGKWGTVCDDYWGMNDAAVVCKQLGCGSAVGATHHGHFGRGSGPIWMNVVGCKGTESALSDCEHGGWGEHDCDHSEDAGVICSGKGRACCLPLGLGWGKGPWLCPQGATSAAEVRLVDGGKHCAGRVEVKHSGKWGTICSDSWDMNDVMVVCKQLDCG